MPHATERLSPAAAIDRARRLLAHHYGEGSQADEIQVLLEAASDQLHAARAVQRTDFVDLDHAVYAATCLAGSAPGRVVTVLTAIDTRNREHYHVADGRATGWTDQKAGLDWQPVYLVEAPRREDR